jgi:hypothetical protein
MLQINSNSSRNISNEISAIPNPLSFTPSLSYFCNIQQIKKFCKKFLSIFMTDIHFTFYIGTLDIQLHLFLTLALHGGAWSTSCPTCFAPKKDPWCPLTRRLREPQDWSGNFAERKTCYPDRN